MTFGEEVSIGAGAAGGVVAAAAILGGVRAWFRRTVGRRRDLARRLQRLGTGAQLGFFKSVLEEQPAIRRSFEVVQTEGPEQRTEPHPFREFVFVNRLYYVVAISDRDETVVGFSITTRSRGFHPTFGDPSSRVIWLTRHAPRRARHAIYRRCYPGTAFPGKRIRLGRTTFAQADGESIRWNMGNKHWSYVEVKRSSNSTYYQELAYAATRIVSEQVAREPSGVGTTVDERYGECNVADAPQWATHYRSEGVIATLAASRMGFELKDWLLAPTVDQLRTLP